MLTVYPQPAAGQKPNAHRLEKHYIVQYVIMQVKNKRNIIDLDETCVIINILVYDIIVKEETFCEKEPEK